MINVFNGIILTVTAYIILIYTRATQNLLEFQKIPVIKHDLYAEDIEGQGLIRLVPIITNLSPFDISTKVFIKVYNYKGEELLDVIDSNKQINGTISWKIDPQNHCEGNVYIRTDKLLHDSEYSRTSYIVLFEFWHESVSIHNVKSKSHHYLHLFEVDSLEIKLIQDDLKDIRKRYQTSENKL